MLTTLKKISLTQLISTLDFKNIPLRTTKSAVSIPRCSATTHFVHRKLNKD